MLQAECLRLRGNRIELGYVDMDWAPQDVSALVSAFNAVSSLNPDSDAADDFVFTVADGVDGAPSVNSVTFGATDGAMEALLGRISSHGPDCANIAVRGCSALCNISYCNRPVADRLVTVMSLGGLDAMCSVMTAHPDDEDVQQAACQALWRIADAASARGRSVMRDHAAVLDLVYEAKRKFPSADEDDDGDGNDDGEEEQEECVNYFANEVLDLLDPDRDGEVLEEEEEEDEDEEEGEEEEEQEEEWEEEGVEEERPAVQECQCERCKSRRTRSTDVSGTAE